MPPAPHAKAVYDAAQTYRRNCLERDGALLLPDAPVWTLENLTELHKHFVDSPDTSDAKFFDKFKWRRSRGSAAQRSRATRFLLGATERRRDLFVAVRSARRSLPARQSSSWWGLR
jgi:hypothetical protein